jgi:hypothetical protein
MTSSIPNALSIGVVDKTHNMIIGICDIHFIKCFRIWLDVARTSTSTASTLQAVERKATRGQRSSEGGSG